MKATALLIILAGIALCIVTGVIIRLAVRARTPKLERMAFGEEDSLLAASVGDAG